MSLCGSLIRASRTTHRTLVKGDNVGVLDIGYRIIGIAKTKLVDGSVELGLYGEMSSATCNRSRIRHIPHDGGVVSRQILAGAEGSQRNPIVAGCHRLNLYENEKRGGRSGGRCYLRPHRRDLGASCYRTARLLSNPGSAVRIAIVNSEFTSVGRTYQERPGCCVGVTRRKPTQKTHHGGTPVGHLRHVVDIGEVVGSVSVERYWRRQCPSRIIEVPVWTTESCVVRG